MRIGLSVRFLWRSAQLGLALASAVGACANAATTGAAVPVKIDLPAQVKVQRTMITLGDVAGISTPSLEALRDLMALPLGRAPHAGELIRLERDDIARWIYRKAGLNADQISWSGGSVIEISVAANELYGNRVASFAEAALQDWLLQRSDSVQLQLVSPPRDYSLPVGAVTFRTRPFTEMQPRKRMSVWVDVYVADVFVRSVPVGFEVSAWAQAAVVRNGVAVGERVSVGDTVMHTVDIAALAPSAGYGGVQDTLMSQPFRLRRAVKVGDVLTRTHLEPAPTVARGELVKIQAVVGAVVLESQGEAVQDGRTGQFVRVKPSKSSATILARVKAPGLLEIQP